RKPDWRLPRDRVAHRLGSGPPRPPHPAGTLAAPVAPAVRGGCVKLTVRRTPRKLTILGTRVKLHEFWPVIREPQGRENQCRGRWLGRARTIIRRSSMPML